MAGLKLCGGPPGAVAIICVGLRTRGGGGDRGRSRSAKLILRVQFRVQRRLVGPCPARRFARQSVEFTRDDWILIGAGDDKKAHLETPVAEMGVADSFVAAQPIDPFDGLADDRRPQVADVHLLGDVGTAIVDQHAARRRHRRETGALVGRQVVGATSQDVGPHREVDEPRAGDVHTGDGRVSRESGRHSRGDLAGVALRLFGRGQRSIALEVGEVGTVGGRDPTHFRGQPEAREGGPDRFAQSRCQIAHGGEALLAATWPALGRKRLPSRLKAAICGVTSKPISTSKFDPLTLVSLRGMTMRSMSWVT